MKLTSAHISRLFLAFFLAFCLSSKWALASCTDGIDEDQDGATDMDDMSEGGQNCYTGGTIYYVSSTIGNDAWTGLSPNVNGTNGPKATFAAAMTALQNTNPGDKVLLRKGDSWTVPSGFTLDYRSAGTAAAPVTFGAYGSGARPAIGITQTNGTLIAIRGGSNTETSQYIVFDSLNIFNPNPNTTNRGVGINIAEGYDQYLIPGKPHHFTFTNMLIQHFRLGFLNSSGQYVTIQNSEFQDCMYDTGPGNQNNADDCFLGGGSHLAIRNNTFDGCGKQDNFFAHGLYTGDMDNAVFENNTIQNCASGIKVTIANGVIIRNNHFSHNSMADVSVGGGGTGPAVNILVEKNEFIGSHDAITIKNQHANSTNGTNDVRIVNNIIRDGLGDFNGNYYGLIRIDFDNWMTDITIANNLIYNGGNEPDIVVNDATIQNLQIANNIFYKAGNIAQYGSIELMNPTNFNEISLSHNVYHHPGGNIIRVGGVNFSSLAAFQAEFPGQETGGLAGAPSFISPTAGNFHLTSASLGVDGGLDLGAVVPDDFDGTARPQGIGYDMGPFEYMTGGVPNSRPTVNAGPDQTIDFPVTQANLNGSALDDGLPNPPGSVTIHWTLVSGPAPVVFANAANAATSVSFSQSGTYVLRFTGTDSALSASDDVRITVRNLENNATDDSVETELVTCSDPRNPSQRATPHVCYNLAQPGHVKITIYDKGGREIRTLVDGNRPSGADSMVWDGKNNSGDTVRSGIYILLMEADGIQKKSKIALIN